MNTTLNEIRAHAPCADGWRKLLTHLGKTKADDEPLPISAVLDSNGVDDAIWCLRAVSGHNREIRLFAVWCARQVQHLMTDTRSLAAMDVAERYALGHATERELAAAGDAACAAAGAAAWADAGVAEWDAAWAAAWAAAGDPGGDAGVAAGNAACAAAWAAAGDPGGDAGDAAWAAALDAARDASKDKQSGELRRVCLCIDSGTDPYPIKKSA